MVGVVLILLALFVAGPVAIFVGGALFSALVGWLFAPETPGEEAEAAAA